MAIAVKIDIHPSTFTQGQRSRLDDRARRVAEVSGLNNFGPLAGNLDYQQAIDALIQQYGVYHHNDTSLPLRTVTVRKTHPTIAEVYLDYRRDRWYSVPSQSAHTLATWRTCTITTPWYKREFGSGFGGTPTAAWLNGLPNGIVEYYPPPPAFGAIPITSVPKRWYWERAGMKIWVRTVLEFNPAQGVAPLVNRTNLELVKMGGMRFPPNSIRFDGVQVDMQDVTIGQPVLFAVEYEFTAIIGTAPPNGGGFGGWYNQIAEWNGAWVFTNGLAYEQATFTGAFPIHG